MRQRLSLAVAMVHKPELLILDEPTSGVDPVARDDFWRLLIELSRRDNVTIFISTHFMNEAQRCDRMSMMHAGKVLDSDTPAALIRKQGTDTLEEAFIKYLKAAAAGDKPPVPEEETADAAPDNAAGQKQPPSTQKVFSLQRLLTYSWREALELQRDPFRATLALIGSLILMVVIGYGINLDVNNLRYAVLDRDQSTISQNYTLSLSGSRYFIEQPPITDYETWTGACAAGRSRWLWKSPRISDGTCYADRQPKSACGSTGRCQPAQKRSRVTLSGCTSSGSQRKCGN